MKLKQTICLFTWLFSGWTVLAADFAALCADRAALERVYHSHRLGTKQTFEQAMPRALLEQLVRLDLKKEAVLKKRYGLAITPAMVAAEVQRIDTTTRAPEVLAEIKAALRNDPARFAQAMARPIVVERELRRRFEQDDALHSPQRHEAEQARTNLLVGKTVEGMHDVSWQLGPRPGEQKAETSNQKPVIGNQRSEAGSPLSTLSSQLSTIPPPPSTASSSSGAYTIEATAQLAQTLTSPELAAPGREKLYFEDLVPELQNVLRVQLQKPGDVSAVIETSGGFLVFVAKAKSTETLSAASFSVPKRSYEQWLAEQP